MMKKFKSWSHENNKRHHGGLSIITKDRCCEDKAHSDVDPNMDGPCSDDSQTGALTGPDKDPSEYAHAQNSPYSKEDTNPPRP